MARLGRTRAPSSPSPSCFGSWICLPAQEPLNIFRREVLGVGSCPTPVAGEKVLNSSRWILTAPGPRAQPRGSDSAHTLWEPSICMLGRLGARLWERRGGRCEPTWRDRWLEIQP